ncbi:hypothetical protein E2C01_074730 [Portunus trituberculatus]|uniref:Uncharacterized protein n=1 Tax=Portunus trituberculatus TaxID=210409 RepID=A0A5B7I442_PORTR|nr:hypothetical protein [Portunus trituberculatus]
MTSKCHASFSSFIGATWPPLTVSSGTSRIFLLRRSCAEVTQVSVTLIHESAAAFYPCPEDVEPRHYSFDGRTGSERRLAVLQHAHQDPGASLYLDEVPHTMECSHSME